MIMNFKQWLIESMGRYASEVSSLIEDAVGLDAVIEVLNEEKIRYTIIDIGDKKVIVLPESSLVIYDFDDGYGNVESVEDFVYSNYADDLKDYGDFNEDFWNSPALLYHATTEANFELIKSSDGLKGMCKTRGSGNIGVGCAVFTSMNHEDLLSGSYGSVILTIDTRAMKADGYMPRVSREPAIEEVEATQNLVHRLGLRYDVEYPNDLFLETVIVHGSIPMKYIAV
jgi:hypothetical protein